MLSWPALAALVPAIITAPAFAPLRPEREEAKRVINPRRRRGDRADDGPTNRSPVTRGTFHLT